MLAPCDNKFMNSDIRLNRQTIDQLSFLAALPLERRNVRVPYRDLHRRRVVAPRHHTVVVHTVAVRTVVVHTVAEEHFDHPDYILVVGYDNPALMVDLSM